MNFSIHTNNNAQFYLLLFIKQRKRASEWLVGNSEKAEKPDNREGSTKVNASVTHAPIITEPYFRLCLQWFQSSDQRMCIFYAKTVVIINDFHNHIGYTTSLFTSCLHFMQNKQMNTSRLHFMQLLFPHIIVWKALELTARQTPYLQCMLPMMQQVLQLIDAYTERQENKAKLRTTIFLLNLGTTK